MALVSWLLERWAPFWPKWWALLVITIAGVGGWWAYRQKRSHLKIIHDFPTKGEVHRHYAEWKDENFDRLLSAYVRFGRAANAIDENRKDFQRVQWGTVANDPSTKPEAEGPLKLGQMWFAGNHSDMGGSDPETESRLSDNALS